MLVGVRAPNDTVDPPIRLPIIYVFFLSKHIQQMLLENSTQQTTHLQTALRWPTASRSGPVGNVIFNVEVCVPVCMYVCLHMYVCAHGSQRSCFKYHPCLVRRAFLPFELRSLTGLGLATKTKLTTQKMPGICPSLPPQHWGLRSCHHVHFFFFYTGSGDGAQHLMPAANTPWAGLSPHPRPSWIFTIQTQWTFDYQCIL